MLAIANRGVVRRALRSLGPGLITGAADDDPSGVATYSQAGAQFGFSLLWTMPLMLPLMAAIQLVCARIGCVTGRGLAANMRERFPSWVVHSLVLLLLAANILNIAADLAAMADALQQLLGGSAHLYALGFGVLCMLMQLCLPYRSYVRMLKWMTLALLAYVAVAVTLHVDSARVLDGALHPRLAAPGEGGSMLLTLVALFGTTISPYLFFWQAGLETEASEARRLRTPEQIRQELRRISVDTLAGTTFASVVAFCILLAAGATLHPAGIRDIGTSAQAAQALLPVAGEFAYLLFALGIIGTGMLAVPVLTGSAAYAVAEAVGWRASLDAGSERGRGRGFHAVIAVATIMGMLLCLTPVQPMRELFWAAVLNGVVAVPVMAATLLVASSPRIMRGQAIGPVLRMLGWTATGLMVAAAVASFAIA